MFTPSATWSHMAHLEQLGAAESRRCISARTPHDSCKPNCLPSLSPQAFAHHLLSPCHSTTPFIASLFTSSSLSISVVRRHATQMPLHLLLGRVALAQSFSLSLPPLAPRSLPAAFCWRRRKLVICENTQPWARAAQVVSPVTCVCVCVCVCV